MHNTKSQYDRKVRFYIAVRSFVESVQALIQALIDGFFLGLLKRSTLHSIDSYYYQTWHLYYNETYNLSGLLNWEQAAMESYFQHCRHLMVTGAGGGREVFALLKMGYNVDSSECHPELAASANNLLKKQGLSNRVMLADRDVVPDTENSYDGLIVGWGSYMLIQGRKRRIAFLRQMRTRVKPGSPLMVSFFHRKHEERKFRVTCLLGNIFRNILGADPLEMGDALRPNYVHFFTVDEIRQELQEAGFKLAFYDTHIYGHAIGLASEEYSACDG